MSLYGNIKRIGSQSFQFDRVYNNRLAMDEAATTDGVYPGRYVLVEYGERYTEREVNGQMIREQRPEYTTNYNIDHNNYNNVYDSTVWQKIYTRQLVTDNGVELYKHSEKYVMVAELNALAPDMDLEVIDSATLIAGKNYTHIDNNEVFDEDTDYYIITGINQDGTPQYTLATDITEFDSGIDYYKLTELPLYYGENNDQLHNVSEIQFNKPYFDEVRDTELTYILKMPKPLELEVNKDIDYHQEKFDIYHTHETETAGGNFIGWKPKPESGVIPDTDNGGKKITDDTQFSKQELNMYLPAFGDVLGALYDVLFGKSTDGGIRPYFTAEGLEESNLEGSDLTAFDGPAKINDILANNTQGLAGVLKALFTDSTLPGKVRYYLSSDWLAKNTSDDSNIPGILNKPKIIFDGRNENNIVYNSHYTIDYSNWCLSKIYSTYTAVNITKLLTAPNDINNTASQANQEAIEVEFDIPNNNVIVRGNLASLNSFASTNPSQGSGKWIGLVLECNDRITNIKWGEYQLTENDVAESASIGLDDNCIIFWVKAEDLPRTIILTNKKGQKQNITFSFEQANL